MKVTTATRPANMTDEHLEYLDALQESGRVNMFGAAAPLQAQFELSRNDARDILLYWIDSYDSRHPV